MLDGEFSRIQFLDSKHGIKAERAEIPFLICRENALEPVLGRHVAQR